jgi:hypothetical protein
LPTEASRQPTCLTLATRRCNYRVGQVFRGSFESTDRQPMDDTLRQTQSNPGSGQRSGRTVNRVALLLTVVGISAAVFWATYGQLGAFSRGAAAHFQALAPSHSGMEGSGSDETMPSLNSLQQSVQELQTTQQRTADALELIQRQMASEQGERKLLSEQVGALSGRVSGLPGSQPARNALASTVTTGTAVQLPKRRPVAPTMGAANPPARTVGARPPT